MSNIYLETIERVCLGARFSVDLQGRNLKVDGKYVIKNGEYEGELGIAPVTTQEMLEKIETLYQKYKHSIPSERSEAKRNVYFKALREHELDNDDMLYGETRDKAQVSLELYILICILNGCFKWDEITTGSWFWQSENDKDLVILRNWIENK